MSDKQTTPSNRFWWRDNDAPDEKPCLGEARPGERCPACDLALLAYDGLFVLTCPRCGYVAEHGAFT